MSFVTIDVRNALLELNEDDIESLRNQQEVSNNVVDYFLKTTLSNTQGQENHFVAASNFITNIVKMDIKAFKRVKKKDRNNQKVVGRFARFNLFGKNNFRMLVPLISSTACPLLVVDVSGRDMIPYSSILIYTHDKGGLRRTRKGINVSKEERSALTLIDEWLSICLARDKVPMEVMETAITKKLFPEMKNDQNYRRFFCMVTALKLYLNSTKEDVSFKQEEVIGIRQYMAKNLPVEMRHPSWKRIGVDIINIIRGIGLEAATMEDGDNVTEKNNTNGRDGNGDQADNNDNGVNKDNDINEEGEGEKKNEIVEDEEASVRGEKENSSDNGKDGNETANDKEKDKDKNENNNDDDRPVDVVVCVPCNDELDEISTTFLPPSQRMDDPYRKTDFVNMREKKKENMERRAKAALEEKSTVRRSKRIKDLNPTQQLMSLMSSSSDKEEKSDDDKKLSTATDSKSRKRSREDDDSGKTPEGNERNNKDDNINVDEKEENEDADNSTDGEEPVGNEENDDDYKYNSDDKEDNDEDGKANANASVTRKRKIKHYLSKTVKDEDCFIDETFFADAKTRVYKDMKEAKIVLADHRSHHGYFVTIRKSTPNYLLARCKSHVGCPCHVHIGNVDPMGVKLMVKAIDRRHIKGKHLTHGPGGRKFQERVKLQGERTFDRAQRNMAKTPKPKDIVESARKEDGVSLSYLAGNRIVNANRKMSHEDALKSYEQLKGYLKKFAKLNKGSVVDIKLDDDNSVTHVFVCPGIMNDRLKWVKRVISIDACHRMTYGGTLYVASCYSANQDIYPIAIGMTSRNECYDGWYYFLRLLRKACPILSDIPDNTFVRGRDIVCPSSDDGDDDSELYFNNDDDEINVNVNEVVEDANIQDQEVNVISQVERDNNHQEDVIENGEQARGVTNVDGEMVEEDNGNEVNDTNYDADNEDRNNGNADNDNADNDIAINENVNNDTVNIEDNIENDNNGNTHEQNNNNVYQDAENEETDIRNDGGEENRNVNDNDNNQFDHDPENINEQNESENHVSNSHENNEHDGDVQGGGVDDNIEGLYPENFINTDENQEDVQINDNNENEQWYVRFNEVDEMKTMIKRRSEYQWLSVADRDKGIARACKELFPHMHATNCSVHIRRNVEQKHGVRAAGEIRHLAKCYSIKEEEVIFNNLRQISAEALDYVQQIPPEVWRNTAFLNPTLPPRYDITTSNGVESANNMLYGARNGPWLQGLSSALLQMSERIHKLREKYKKVKSDTISATKREDLWRDYTAATSYDILQTKNDPPTYIVTYNHGDSNKASTIHKVVPSIATCSCGKWHMNLIPCRHALAWARLIKQWAFRTVCHKMCSNLHLVSSSKELYSVGFDLVVLDNIRFDGKTKPNVHVKPTGRPPKKRMRKRPTNPSAGRKCTICKLPGHNKATCTAINDDLPPHSVF